MDNKSEQLKDFIALPRQIKDDYIKRKITRNQFDVLLWIWINANPYNGYFTADYKALQGEFSGRITYDNMRKVISSLGRTQHIYFPSHKGRGGSFVIYPVGFLLTSGRIQTLEYLRNKSSVTTQSQPLVQPTTKLEHNLTIPNHNFSEMKNTLIEQFSMDKPKQPTKPITTAYTNNDNKNNKYNIDSKFNIKNDRTASKKEVPVHSFTPKSWEEEWCKGVAELLGETDMRFLLSCYHNYGYNHVERAWGIFEDVLSKNKIENKAKYFNKLVRSLYEKSN